ncbi:MAG TPA: NADH-quinone oxidoreductase subunit J [Acidimicrobiia bacterium]|jgi:NADH-quinone oxidoreductase subunit J|nr:NADH-quinone oxidoreductase subunit J [Acidimicrobiia bacterium]
MIEALLFVAMGLVALAGAVTVVAARNPIYSAMGLLATLFSVAVIYVTQLAHLVAAVQVIVYAGAVLTLFLFVIMLIGVDKEERREESLPHQRLIVGVVAGAIVLLAAGLTLFGDFDWVPAAAPATLPDVTNGTIEAVAVPLFTDWVLAFEATALLLTVAAAGAIALAHYRRRES